VSSASGLLIGDLVLFEHAFVGQMELVFVVAPKGQRVRGGADKEVVFEQMQHLKLDEIDHHRGEPVAPPLAVDREHLDVDPLPHRVHVQYGAADQLPAARLDVDQIAILLRLQRRPRSLIHELLTQDLHRRLQLAP